MYTHTLTSVCAGRVKGAKQFGDFLLIEKPVTRLLKIIPVPVMNICIHVNIYMHMFMYVYMYIYVYV
jgi:hypothetical protein